MTGFHVIVRTDQGGGFLGDRPGKNGMTWVRDLRLARIFPSKEAAQRECCPENERPVPLSSLLPEPRP